MLARSKKTLRLRGSRTGGFGRKNGTGAGKNGGTGKAGSMTHNYLQYELKRRKEVKNRNSINLKIIELKKEVLAKKGFLKLKQESQKVKTYAVTDKFLKKYKKILGLGECSIKILPHKALKVSKSAEKKLL